MENKTDKGRQFEVDCVKFFAILFMMCIHVYELLGQFDYYNVLPDTLFRNAVEFCGGPLAAPVFMFCMGIGMIYTRHNSFSDFIRRGFILLITGYLLNFFRRTIFQLIMILLGVDMRDDLIGDLLIVDILQFAGMAFLFIGVMKRLNITVSQMCIIAVVLQAAGIWAMKLEIESPVLQNIAGLLLPTGEDVAFPMFLWLVYPAFGMLFAKYTQSVEDKARMYGKLMAVSAVFFTAYSSALIFVGYDIRLIYGLYQDSYYHQSFVSFLWILPLIILVLGICYFALRNLEQTVIGRFVIFSSVNLNRIYIIQWLILGMIVVLLVFLDIIGELSPAFTVAAGIILAALSIGITALYVRIRHKRK